MCKCRLDASVRNNIQRWNNNKCRSECKELIAKGKCDDGLIWNHGACECERDKSCDVFKYLDSVNCKCRKRLIDRMIQKCDEDIHENEMVFNATVYDYERVCRS